MAVSTFVMLLDYRGGARTNTSVRQLRGWNPKHPIHVLDNASPDQRSEEITHQNEHNSYPGGGLRDCLSHAAASGVSHLMFIVNDVTFESPVFVRDFESLVETDPAIVQVSAAVTPDSAQAAPFPWMANQGNGAARATGHADLLVSLIDLEFVQEFGGFPPSRGGWGYSWELAHHANLKGRRIIVLDSCVVRHQGEPQAGYAPLVRTLKSQEALTVYRQKYGSVPWYPLRAELEARWTSLVKFG